MQTEPVGTHSDRPPLLYQKGAWPVAGPGETVGRCDAGRRSACSSGTGRRVGGVLGVEAPVRANAKACSSRHGSLMPDWDIRGQTQQDYPTASITVWRVPPRAAPNDGLLLVEVNRCCIKCWLMWTTKFGHQNDNEAKMCLSSKRGEGRMCS